MFKNIQYISITYLIPILLIILLLFANFNLGHLVFHEFAEYFSVFVGLGISLITYYTYNFTKNRYLLFIGLGYFWIAILDILHTQTYLGMNLYDIDDSNTSTTFWIFARIFEASIVAIAPFMRYREYKAHQITGLFLVITIAIIYIAMNFPLELFIAGEGLTSLKKGLESFIIFILLLALYINKKYSHEFTLVIKKSITYSIVLTILAEVSFTLYADIYGIMNVVGHVFKFLSFWVLLHGIIKVSIQDPYSIMQKNATTYNAIPYPAIVIDNIGIVRQVNRAACDEIEKDEAEIVGHRNHELYHPKSISEEDCPICQSIKDGEELEDCVLMDTDLHTVKQYSLTSIQSNEYNIRGMVQVTVDMTIKTELEKKLKKQSQELEYKSNYDMLTNLPNRILLQDRIIHAIQQAKHSKTEFALVLIDLDQFKEINDTLGHKIGDEVLKIFSIRLQESISEEDTLGRFGGDEFTIIIENMQSIESITLLVQKIIDKAKQPILIAEHTLYISASIGISLYPKNSDDMYDLLKYSDSAMYKAKTEGRNNFQFYSPEMTENAMKKIVVQNDLRKAIENEEFVVYYQPQIGIAEDKNYIVGMEALVRWQHPILGLVPPSEFIPIAEETGMIVELDRLVMRMAIIQMAKWYKEELNPGILSLNLAMKQLHKDDFIEVVKKIIEDSGCHENKHLSFEITESGLMTNPESSIEKLNILKDMGIQISIDDFGTGYSSLTYLKRLPINKLKIDQSFTRGIPEDKDDAAIVKAIISLAQNLNLKIIAEGVETQEQKNFMYENGCTEIQGYLYSKPMAKDETRDFLISYKKS